jgi:F0F1-type ATP synthase membrane subunit b/b'
MFEVRQPLLMLLAVLMLNLPICAQQATDPDLLSAIKSLDASLKETRDQLQESRTEIQQLRSEVNSLRDQLRAEDRSSAEESGQSVNEKISALQDDQQLLKTKVDDQYQSKVESGSKYRVKLSALLLANLSSTSGAVDDIDVPNLAGGAYAYSPGSFSGSIRQSEFGLNVDGPTVFGARTSGLLLMDFFGGLAETTNGSDFGIARVKIGRARFDWADTTLEVGQMEPLISPLSPTSYASLAIPALGYSGNLWAWTPQLRVEHRWNFETWRNTLQAGILDSLSGQYPGYAYQREPQAGENSRQPALAARDSISREAWGRKMTFGVGGYYGRQNYLAGRNVDAWAATADWNVPLTKWFELSGEAYRGQAIGGLWAASGISIVANGPVYQPTTAIQGLNAVGGWAQIKFRATPKLEFNGAFGLDNPFAADLFALGTPMPYEYVARNHTALVNVIDHPRSNLIVALEYRHLDTYWTAASPDSADHVDASVGVIF